MKEALKEMYQLLLTEPHIPTVCTKLERIAREALAQPEQEPVAWMHNFIDGGISIGKRPADLKRHPDRWTALYTTPPQRKPLTDEEIGMTFRNAFPVGQVVFSNAAIEFARTIEAAHNIKETTE